MEKNRKIVTTLVSIIIVLSLVSGVLAYQLTRSPKATTEESNSRAFVFDWPRGTQNVTENPVTLTINATFTKIGDKLNVLTRINDTDPLGIPSKYLMVAFDLDNDSRITGAESQWLMWQNNMTSLSWTIQWMGAGLTSSVSPATFFYCHFDGQGYVYNATYPMSDPVLWGTQRIYGDLVQIVYEQNFHRYVSVCFHTGLK
jgi:hypothetical protein